MNIFKSVSTVDNHHPAEFDQKIYLERTQRNHFWLGGPAAQLKLHELRVGIAGLGGMGSHIAEALVRLGVGHLKVADPDIVELSNLNRQTIATAKSVGTLKVHALVDRLRGIAKDFELVTYEDGITPENVEEFVEDLDVVIDEIDVYPLVTHQLLHRASRLKQLPIYSGFVIGLGVHLYKFHGEAFTLDDFLGGDQERDQIKNPTGDYLVRRFGSPLPSYLAHKSNLEGFQKELDEGRAPIFGASCLFGHALVPIRVVTDFLGLHQRLNVAPTPVMPHFLVLDPLDFCLKVVNFRDLEVLGG